MVANRLVEDLRTHRQTNPIQDDSITNHLCGGRLIIDQDMVVQIGRTVSVAV